MVTAGAIPTTIPATSIRRAENRNTRGSSCSPSTRGSAAPPITAMARTAANASGSAIAVAAAAISSDSASSGRMALQRVAPSAARTATSRARAVPRASRRLATLTIARSSRSPVAAKAMSRIGPRSPTIDSRSGRITKTRFFAWSGYFFARSAHIGTSCPASPAGFAPGLKRTNASKAWPIESGLCCANQRSASRGMAKLSGATPTTSALAPANRIVVPSTEGLAPNIVRQARCDKTTRLRSGAAKSSAVNPRPAAIGRPKSSKNPSDTPKLVTCRAPASVRMVSSRR